MLNTKDTHSGYNSHSAAEFSIEINFFPIDWFLKLSHSLFIPIGGYHLVLINLLSFRVYFDIILFEVDEVDGVDEVDEVDEVDGVDGVDEVDEVDEVDGVDGVDEVDGVDGVDGVDEVDEVDEVDGVDEVDEVDGVNGVDDSTLFIGLSSINVVKSYNPSICTIIHKTIIPNSM